MDVDLEEPTSRFDGVHPGQPESPSESALPQFAIPPISGFWRRLAAFLLDGLILGLIGQALGWSLSTVWFQVGPYGRVVGELVALLYFGLMDSRISNGQTLGKRVLKVAVRDRDGQAIGMGRSALRTLIWLVPATLNGWALPVMTNPIFAWIAGVILFGVGGAVVATMVFNRRTRQGLHDMLTGTYVLALTGEPVETLPLPARPQWILAGAVVLLALIMASVSGVIPSRLGAPIQQVIELQKSLQKDDRFFSVSVFDQTFYESGGDTSRALRIQAWYKGVPSDSSRSAILNDIAKVTLAVDGVEDYDLIRVDLKSAYDLGIASGYLTYGDGQSVAVWRQRTDKGAP